MHYIIINHQHLLQIWNLHVVVQWGGGGARATNLFCCAPTRTIPCFQTNLCIYKFILKRHECSTRISSEKSFSCSNWGEKPIRFPNQLAFEMYPLAPPHTKGSLHKAAEVPDTILRKALSLPLVVVRKEWEEVGRKKKEIRYPKAFFWGPFWGLGWGECLFLLEFRGATGAVVKRFRVFVKFFLVFPPFIEFFYSHLFRNLKKTINFEGKVAQYHQLIRPGDKYTFLSYTGKTSKEGFCHAQKRKQEKKKKNFQGTFLRFNRRPVARHGMDRE